MMRTISDEVLNRKIVYYKGHRAPCNKAQEKGESVLPRESFIYYFTQRIYCPSKPSHLNQAVDRLVQKLEVPAPWEGHEVVYNVKDH